ncbi:MAG: selenium-binding protein SBP56-related protein, partial [Gemmatimonadales bacterium]
MPRLRPDPTFYASPTHAMAAPPETLAYVTLPDAGAQQPDAIGVVDVQPGSPSYGQLVHQVEMPYPGDELHHFGWNACSSHLCPWAGHAHVERRYLIAPG